MTFLMKRTCRQDEARMLAFCDVHLSARSKCDKKIRFLAVLKRGPGGPWRGRGGRVGLEGSKSPTPPTSPPYATAVKTYFTMYGARHRGVLNGNKLDFQYAIAMHSGKYRCDDSTTEKFHGGRSVPHVCTVKFVGIESETSESWRCQASIKMR